MKYLIFISILFINLNGYSQKYSPDKIKIDEKYYDYRFHHLEQYFNFYPEKRIVPSKDSTIITRGYIAYFEIYDNELYLLELETTDLKNTDKTISIRDKFSSSKDERIPLKWINGVIQIGLGTDDFSKDSLYPINTNNLILEIQKGKIQRKLYFNKDEMRIFKNSQLNKYKNTSEYLNLYNKLQNLGLTEIEISQHIYNNILYYSRKIYIQK